MKLIQNLSAVTGACLMTRKTVFDEVGGFDSRFSQMFNDVDFCLRLREKGYWVVYSPYAELYHHESQSRGSDFSKETFPIYKQAVNDFEQRWGAILRSGDPFFNPASACER